MIAIGHKTAIDKLAVVYWIHYSHHVNPFTEGYIGISTQLHKRLYAHTKSQHVGNRLRKGAVVSILHENITLEVASEIERNYRPAKRIGWNVCEGGGVPPSKKGIVNPSNILVGEKRTEAQKASSREHSKRMKGRIPWNKGKAGSQKAWNKGIPNPSMKVMASIERECPHCGKLGKGSSMLRWHFDKCKYRKDSDG